MLSVEREPVAWAVEISGCLKFFEQKKSAENARRRYERVMDSERMEPYPLFAEQPAPVAVDAEILERFPEINFANYGQEEVEALQAWAFEAYEAIARLNVVKP